MILPLRTADTSKASLEQPVSIHAAVHSEADTCMENRCRMELGLQGGAQDGATDVDLNS